jgi:hypothetical protein
LLVAALAATACSGHYRAGPHAARLVVRQLRGPGPIPVEGAYSYARVERDGKTVAQVRLSAALVPRAVIRLDPGSYRLVSFQRNCNGNCHLLGPPSGECGRAFSARANETVRATVRVTFGTGCRISLR